LRRGCCERSQTSEWSSPFALAILVASATITKAQAFAIFVDTKHPVALNCGGIHGWDPRRLLLIDIADGDRRRPVRGPRTRTQPRRPEQVNREPERAGKSADRFNYTSTHLRGVHVRELQPFVTRVALETAA